MYVYIYIYIYIYAYSSSPPLITTLDYTIIMIVTILTIAIQFIANNTSGAPQQRRSALLYTQSAAFVSVIIRMIVY